MANLLVRRALAILVLVSVGGCGGGGSSPTIVPAAPNQPQIVQKTIQILVPAKQSTARVSQYVSRNTQGIGVSFGTSPFTFPIQHTPTAAFDVSVATSTLCGVPAASGARTCSLTFGVPVGTDDFQVTAWDCVPSAGSFAGCNPLSMVMLLSQAVSPGANTALNLVLNGVVNSVAFSVSPSTLPAGPTVANGGALQTATLSANALDADGNVIMGNGNYVDAAGNALTIGANQSAPSSGGSTATTLSATTFTPAAPTVTVTYLGGNSWGTVFTPNVTGGSVATNPSATLNITPTVSLFPIPTASSQPAFITAGPSGDTNVYFTENATNQIGRITPTGTITELSSPPASGGPSGITAATDGNIWWTTFTNTVVGQVNKIAPSNFTAGGITVVGSMNPNGTQIDLVDGHDGNMYVSEAATADIAQFPMAGGTVPTFTTSSAPYGMTYGPDGRVWFADQGGSIQAISTGASPVIGTAYAASGTPATLAVGSDGNIWCAAGNYVEWVATAGPSVTVYSTPIALGTVAGIAPGTDGALWFTGRGPLAPGNGGIGRITTGGVITTYFAGFGSTDDPLRIAVASDGSLWFTEQSGNKIGRLIY